MGERETPISLIAINKKPLWCLIKVNRGGCCFFLRWFVMPFFVYAGHLLSPSPTPHFFTRWSTSRLNSGATSTSTSPCGSARSSFNYRQPYLGWRSQERLTRPRTPAERLAAGLLPEQKQHLHQAQQNQVSILVVRTQYSRWRQSDFSNIFARCAKMVSKISK